MKTRASLSKRQEELKAKHKLSNRQFNEMLEMLAGLTPAERATLKDPDFITEDEADLIYSDRTMQEPGPNIPVEEIFAEFGYTPRRQRKA
jgi:hypothetical protein